MKTLLFSALAVVALSVNTCFGVVYTLSGLMDVQQAGTNGGFGGGSGNGTGTISGTYDDVTNLLDYTLTWQDLLAPGTVTNIHFHDAPVGSGGGVDLGVPPNSGSDWVSPLSNSGITLSAGQESNLLGGLWYVNVHTSNFGSGEIRGQVTATPIPEPTTMSLFTVALLSMVSLARRK